MNDFKFFKTNFTLSVVPVASRALQHRFLTEKKFKINHSPHSIPLNKSFFDVYLVPSYVNQFIRVYD